LKVRLPDDTYLNMPIFSRGNTEEYRAHTIAVLRIIKQKGLDAKCRKLGEAVVKQSEALKNLLEAAGSKDTVLLDVDVETRRVEIEQTQQMLQNPRRLTLRQLPRHTSN
jgi:hypothetical protein